MSLSELKEKLERLNDLTAKDDQQREKIVNIFNEVIGQIRGNIKLKTQLNDLLENIVAAVAKPESLSEPAKRVLVFELRERLRHLNISNIDGIVEDKK